MPNCINGTSPEFGHYSFVSLETRMSLLPIKLLVPLLVLIGSLNAALLGGPRGEPSYKDFAKMARYLVHRLGV